METTLSATCNLAVKRRDLPIDRHRTSAEIVDASNELRLLLRALRVTLRRSHFSTRVAVSLAVLLLCPFAFEHLVRTVPRWWLEANGMMGVQPWAALMLLLIVHAGALGARYCAARSDRANRLPAAVIAVVRSCSDVLTADEVSSAAATLRAASESRWCHPSVSREALREAERLAQLLDARSAYPIPANDASIEIDRLPICA